MDILRYKSVTVKPTIEEVEIMAKSTVPSFLYNEDGDVCSIEASIDVLIDMLSSDIDLEGSDVDSVEVSLVDTLKELKSQNFTSINWY